MGSSDVRCSCVGRPREPASAAGGQPIAVTDLQPGDIVTFYSESSHAGIYIGDGMMVHASTFGTPVRVAPISTTPIHNARRW